MEDRPRTAEILNWVSLWWETRAGKTVSAVWHVLGFQMGGGKCCHSLWKTGSWHRSRITGQQEVCAFAVNCWCHTSVCGRPVSSVKSKICSHATSVVCVQAASDTRSLGKSGDKTYLLCLVLMCWMWGTFALSSSADSPKGQPGSVPTHPNTTCVPLRWGTGGAHLPLPYQQPQEDQAPQ